MAGLRGGRASRSGSIPGVSSAIAAPALAGIPLTHRQLTQGFTVVSGHLPPGDPGSTLDWAALARAGTTLVVLMGVATLPAIAAELVAQGMPADTPAATIADAGLPSQRDVRGRLDDIAARTRGRGRPAAGRHRHRRRRRLPALTLSSSRGDRVLPALRRRASAAGSASGPTSRLTNSAT